MTKTVFLDGADDVVAESRHGASLSKAQSQNGAIVQAITDAPDAIVYRGKGIGYHHRKISGDGTQLEDYAEVPELAPALAARAKSVDARTAELLENGTFEYPNASGNFFSLSNLSTRFIQQAVHAPAFPVEIPLAGGDGTFTVADLATATALAAAAFTATDAIIQAGESVKADMKAAPTLQLLLLVKDTR